MNHSQPINDLDFTAPNDAGNNLSFAAESELSENQKIAFLKQGTIGAQHITLSAAMEVAGGIEFIVQLAAKGEIDPKDVDISYVTDKFLAAIAAQPKENLRQSGKVIFHASVLLRIKAEALLADRSYNTLTDDYLEFSDDGDFIYDSDKNVIARQITLQDLEKALVRRASNKQSRPRKVTLDELINALREAERIEKMRMERKPKARIQLDGMHQINDVDDILDLAHDEDIELTIGKVEQIIAGQFLPGESLGLLDLIIKLGKKSDWVDAFLAVLFLANSGKLTLEQNEFYGPLTIMRTQVNTQTNLLTGQIEAS